MPSATASGRRSGRRASRELPFRRDDGSLRIELDGETRRIDRATRRRLAVAEACRPDAHRHARAGARSTPRHPPRTTSALLDERRRPGPGRRGPVPHAPPASQRRRLPRGVHGPLDLPTPSPVNAVVVLSRADEIGAARPDALESARPIAARYAADRRVRELASGVVPVAGLLAETGATLRQAQFELAAHDRPPRADPARRPARLGRAVPRPGPEPARRGDPRGPARPFRPVRAPPVGRG